ncbi:MAG TPA: hypothetical protein V6D19_02535 [Stenomitos sp.]
MKKLILALMTLSAVGAAIATPLQAQAFDINIGGYHITDHDNTRYAVYYRWATFMPWKLKGTYGTRFEAEYALHKLQNNGYYAFIERH